MPLQIADPAVVAKVERLASETGWTKTAVVEKAVDRLARELRGQPISARISAILAHLDRVPERADAFDPLEWDEQGLS